MIMTRLVLLSALLLGCSKAPLPPGGEEGGMDGGAPPVLDPALFDCSARARPLPARSSPVPAACALDPRCRTPQVAGHRGVSGAIAPENTLSAFRAALALGVEFVETDPRPSKDGVIVNMHDPTVDRTTYGTGAVSAMTFEELRRLRIKADGIPGDYACEQVPTLREILELCKGRAVVLIDANKTDRVDLLVQAIRDADAVEWAVFDTSSVDKIDRALALLPQLHFQNRPESLSEIEAQFDHFAPRLPVIVELNLSDWSAGAELVHRRGSRAFTDVFVADFAAAVTGDLSAYEQALKSGIDIFQSDRPDLVMRFLRQRGLRADQ
jgi:glycerophosphoryl diester phosphodiesterase